MRRFFARNVNTWLASAWCEVVATARNSGQDLRQPFAEVLKIKDGLVIEGAPYYYDTVAVSAAPGRS